MRLSSPNWHSDDLWYLCVSCNLGHHIQSPASLWALMLLKTSLYCGFKRCPLPLPPQKERNPQLVKGFRIVRVTCTPYLWTILPQTSRLWNAHIHLYRCLFLECRANDTPPTHTHPASPGEPHPASLAPVQIFIWFVWLSPNSFIPLSLEISSWHTTPLPWGY